MRRGSGKGERRDGRKEEEREKRGRRGRVRKRENKRLGECGTE